MCAEQRRGGRGGIVIVRGRVIVVFGLLLLLLFEREELCWDGEITVFLDVSLLFLEGVTVFLKVLLLLLEGVTVFLEVSLMSDRVMVFLDEVSLMDIEVGPDRANVSAGGVCHAIGEGISGGELLVEGSMGEGSSRTEKGVGEGMKGEGVGDAGPGASQQGGVEACSVPKTVPVLRLRLHPLQNGT